MKRGIVVINAFANYPKVLAQVRKMEECLKKRGVELDLTDNGKLHTYLERGEVKTKLDGYDFVLYWDKDSRISAMLEKAGLRLFNSAKAIDLCDDKMLTHIALADCGIEMPKTISAPLCYTQESEDFSFIDKVTEQLQLPMVVKENYGSFGLQVYLAKNHDELLSLYKRLRQKQHLYQEFISSSYGRDLRIIVIGQKAVAAMERKTDKDFRANVELGAVGTPFELKEDFCSVAEKAAQVLGLDYCGVDLLFGENGQPILCEVNSNAYFCEISRVTGIDVASVYADYLYKEIYE